MELLLAPCRLLLVDSLINVAETLKLRLHYAFFPRVLRKTSIFADIIVEKKFASLFNIGQATLGTMSCKTRQLAKSVPILGKSRIKRKSRNLGRET